MKPDPQHKRAVRAAFDRAAPAYAAAARVQGDICTLLAGFARQHAPATPPRRVLDGGCGTGFGQDFLQQAWPRATHLALDFAPAMLAQLRRLHPALPVCGDLEALPLAPGSVDVAWSSLAVQWCDPARVLAELARVLAPGGIAWIATLGPATLWQLEAVWTACGQPSPRLPFHAASHWQQAAVSAGLKLRGSAEQSVDALAPDLRELLRQIRAIGAHRVPGPARRPLTRHDWQALQGAYEAHRRGDGLLPATYDVILLALEKQP